MIHNKVNTLPPCDRR